VLKPLDQLAGLQVLANLFLGERCEVFDLVGYQCASRYDT
jgi:hypothetical protein